MQENFWNSVSRLCIMFSKKPISGIGGTLSSFNYVSFWSSWTSTFESTRPETKLTWTLSSWPFQNCNSMHIRINMLNCLNECHILPVTQSENTHGRMMGDKPYIFCIKFKYLEQIIILISFKNPNFISKLEILIK